MILGESQQQFASPEEALKHYGTKGMKWGVRKEKETGSRDAAAKASPKDVAARNETQKQVMEMVVGKPAIDRSRFNVSDSGHVSPEKNDDGFHLTKEQKIALGIGAASIVGVAGFVAYKHYTNGQLNPSTVPGWLAKDAHGNPLIPDALKKGLGHGDPAFMLHDPDFLVTNLSKGYADIRPKDGFKSVAVAQRHAELIRTFEEFRNKYPTVRNLAVEVVPMSHVPGMETMTSMGTPAAVMHMKPGQARLIYNDWLPALTEVETGMMLEQQPGQITHAGFLGYHEMGHMLATAGGVIPPSWNVTKAGVSLQQGEMTPGNIRRAAVGGVRYKNLMGDRHKRLMKKHGFTFKELSKLSRYGATQPAEALAELVGYAHSPTPPGWNDVLTSDQRTRAVALMNDLGGVV